MKFGERLRTLRNQARLSQGQLAERIYVSPAYVSKIELGAMAPPSALTIHRMALALHADEQELMALAGKVPARLKSAMKEHMLLAELVQVLSKQVLSDEMYQQLIAMAQEEQAS